MFAQQRHVAAIGAEKNVEGVAGDWHRADQAFQRDISRHAREQKPRHAEPGAISL